MRYGISPLVLLVLMLGLSCASPQETLTDDTPISAEPTEAAPPRLPGVPAQAEPNALPTDPDVRKGKLANGLTYYVRANAKPENRAALRLAVNAGSILEEDDQLGLAHFTEHMAFNGTTNFEKQTLIDYLESIGMRMGPHLNAYTSFDETVYMIEVPTDKATQVDTAFQILRDWATEVTFEDVEVDKERGVVIEEWRLGRGASARIRDKQFPVLLQGSRYAERSPIGTKEILEGFSYETLQRFYRDWYRPDLMAVVAVGDFDADEIEAKIQTLFADIPAAENPRPRTEFDVPGHEETLFAIAGDPEATFEQVGVIYKQENRPFATEADYRQRVVERLYNAMLSTRLSELTQSNDPPFIFGFSGQGAFVRAREFYALQAAVRDGNYTRALETLLTEGERVRRFGFTASEFERQKISMLRSYEQAYNERDKTESRVYAAEYIRNFLVDEPLTGIVHEYEMLQRLLPTIALEEVNRLAAEWIVDTNRVILADGPEKEGAPPLPTDAALLAVFDAVAAKEITPYEEEVSDAPLLPEMPTPGTVVDETVIEEIGVTRLALSNGIDVILKPTDFKNDQVLFFATSPGGHSLVPDELYTPAAYAASLVSQSGVGAFGPIELQKKLAGKVVRMSPNISSRSEGFSGFASPDDFETLLQLVHLYVTAPRADSTAYESFKQRIGSMLINMKASPEAAFRDTLNVTMAQYHYRRRPFSQETLDEMDLAKSFEIYKDRFADLGDFTFYVVGTFEIETIKPLLATYLGSLPAMGREETWRDEGIRAPREIIEKAVYKGVEPKSRVQINLTGPATWTNSNRRTFSALRRVMEVKLREVMREDLGGVYGVGVSGGLSREPIEAYRLSISFGCDPERVEELTRTVFEQIDSLRTVGTTEAYVTKAREAALRAHEVGLQENNYWLTALRFAEQNGLDPRDIPDGPARFYETLTPAIIQEAANTYLDVNNYVRVVLYPENFGF